MNHVSVSPTDGNGPTQGQRKTLTRVGTVTGQLQDSSPRIVQGKQNGIIANACDSVNLCVWSDVFVAVAVVLA